MNNLKLCTSDNWEEFSMLLSVKKVPKLTDNNLKDICFEKEEGSILKFLY